MKHLFLIVLTGSLFSLLPPPRLAAQTAVPVTLSIRQADGAPVVGEVVTLISQPDYTAETAVTGADGQAHFALPRGIYEASFTLPLDAVSALAVAEGGFNGFGITVGDSAITYHFTFQADGNVYFDGAPTAARPSPIIPALEDLHFIGGAGQPTPTDLPGIIVFAPKETPIAATALITPGETAVSPEAGPEAAAMAATPTAPRATAAALHRQRPGWMLLLAILTGIVLGVAIHVQAGRQKR